MNDDKDIWSTYAKGVKRVSKRHPDKGRDPDSLSTKNKRKTSPSELSIKPSTPHSEATYAWPLALVGAMQKKQPTTEILFTKKAERALREGAILIDAKLDLHGMTQVEAHAALGKFMVRQVKLGHRNLLIITGKGSTGKSVLRSNLPQWLEALPAAARILSLRPASVKHGGSGAFYVILKRRRD